jgi:ATP-dependent DNA helicase RecQ
MNSHKSSYMIDVEVDVWYICKILSSISYSISPSYLIRLLKGVESGGMVDDSHQKLEGFGRLSDRSTEFIRCLIRYLVLHNYLMITDTKRGCLGLEEKGLAFLIRSYPFVLYPRQLAQSKYEREAYLRLEKLRKELSEKELAPEQVVFSDHTLGEMAFHFPLESRQLSEIPGMGDFRLNKYGPSILAVLKEVEKEKQEERRTYLESIVQRPSFQEVKAMFEAGMDQEEIASRRKVKVQTVQKMLSDLHEAGLIDLNPWIERVVDPETLKLGSEYFEGNQQVRLRQAFQELGIAYETLRLCRLYVSRTYTCEEPWYADYYLHEHELSFLDYSRNTLR